MTTSGPPLTHNKVPKRNSTHFVLNSQPGLQPATTKHPVRLCCCALLQLHSGSHYARSPTLSRGSTPQGPRADPPIWPRWGAQKLFNRDTNRLCFFGVSLFFGRAIEPSVHFCVLLTTFFEYYSSVVRCVCARFAYPLGLLFTA